MISRLINGIKSLREAVNLAPEVWIAMFIRTSIKPEMHRFLFDISSAMVNQSKIRLPETLWLCFSRLLHHLEKQTDSRFS
jgi:aarF domain-containing kinase